MGNWNWRTWGLKEWTWCAVLIALLGLFAFAELRSGDPTVGPTYRGVALDD